MKNFKLYCIVFTLLLLGIVILSCNKPSDIGLSVQPASDKLNVRFTDTITLNTYSILIDSVRSDNASSNLLGCYMDPIFGKTYSSFYAQADLQNFNNTFGTDPISDSIILYLSYNGYYGDTTTPQALNVYQLNQILYYDSTYYSNQNFTHINEAIGSAVFYPHPNDSVIVGGINQAPQLRIKLSNSVANNILNASTTALADNTDFISFFKGIYVKPSDISITGKGAILYFNVQSLYSGITVYYHNSTSSGLTFNLVFDAGTARINHFEHQYSSTQINQQFANHSLGQNTLFCQSMAGVETYIDFPNIKHLRDSGKVSINQAELVILASQDITNPLYPLPGSMVLYGLDTLGNEISLPDFTLSTYEIPLVNSSEYDFFISDYIQQLLNDSTSTHYNYNHITNLGLHLASSFGAAQANRIIIGGPKNPIYPMKLKLTYTKL